MNYKKVKILTVAKVGSANFYTCNYLKSVEKHHGHDVSLIKKTLENDSDCLIIVGIRNPIERNLSYLFQTYNDNSYNNVKTRKNNYKGEYAFIRKDLDIESDKLIDLYFKQSYHNTFNDWFEEFLEITNIKTFDKEKGLEFYNYERNNTIMVYTLEKLNQNEKYICDTLGITRLEHRNNSENRNYKNLYKKVKDEIKYTREYLDNLLDTDIMRIFYTDEDIKKCMKQN